ncbi:adenylate kinase [Candidatus Woesearchaeota archaeon]|nr:adenylate kinase [Candidatus Woesearchaeota archaeon]
MKLIFLGPPGAGKGTISQRLVRKEGMVQISAGDLLREAVKKQTALGMKAKSYMEKGELVPDQLVIDLMVERVRRPDCKRGFILDGFPRTIAQAEALQRNKIPIDTVVNFTVAEETLIRRLSGRRMHRITGEIFNIHTLPPPPGTKEADLIQRPDDKPEAIKKRIEVYKRETLPLIDFYEREGKLVNVDGEGSSEKVLQGVLKAIA